MTVSNPVSQVQALEALDDMDDFARMANVDAMGPRETLMRYITQPLDKSVLLMQRLDDRAELAAFMAWATANLTPGQVINIVDAMERGESVSFAIWKGAKE